MGVVLYSSVKSHCDGKKFEDEIIILMLGLSQSVATNVPHGLHVSVI